jgi:hypothetical protein
MVLITEHLVLIQIYDLCKWLTGNIFSVTQAESKSLTSHYSLRFETGVLRFFLSCRLALLECVVCVKRCDLWWQGSWKTFSSVPMKCTPKLRPWIRNSDSMTPRWKFSGSNLGWSSEGRLSPHKFIRNCFIVSVCTLHPYIFRTCKFTRTINSYDKNIF